MNTLKSICITHQQAEIHIRGLFTLGQSERTALYLQLRDCLDIHEALILSTCNRTEIYYLHQEDRSGEIMKLLGVIKGIQMEDFKCYFQTTPESTASLRHLYRVAMGLESQVLGDIQIFGQVKQAYQEATDLGMAHTALHRAMHTLFYTHKQVCQETKIKEGAASLSYCTVKLLKERQLAHSQSRILVAGAGKMGTDICKNLRLLGFQKVTVTNRTWEKSMELRRSLGMQVLPFHQIFSSLGQFDVVISTIGALKPLFTAKAVQEDAQSHVLVCLDLCAPRSFADDFLEKYACRYFNIDQVAGASKDTLIQRKKEIPKVEAMVEAALEDFQDWTQTYACTRQLSQFKATLDALRQRTIAAHLKKIDQTQLNLIEEISKSLVDRIVKLPAVQLRQQCERDRAEELSHTLNQLFDPHYQSVTNQKP